MDGKTLSKVCKYCGVVFWTYPSWSYRVSCSVNCPARKITKICNGCQKPFSIRRSIADKRAHCSKECQKRRVTKTCEVCHTVFEARNCEDGVKKFCSEVCRLTVFSTSFRGENSPHWKGGKPGPYGSSWGPQRRKALKRDKGICIHCLKTKIELGENPCAAHKIPFRNFGIERHEEANHIDNLICLCRSCHMKFDWSNGTRS